MSEYDIFHYLVPGGAAALGPLALLFVRFVLYPHYAGKAQRVASPLVDEVPSQAPSEPLNLPDSEYRLLSNRVTYMLVVLSIGIAAALMFLPYDPELAAAYPKSFEYLLLKNRPLVVICLQLILTLSLLVPTVTLLRAILRTARQNHARLDKLLSIISKGSNRRSP
ncbi:MAG: hypothetical protein QOH65_2919 [Methylobacteriaceae bacterium]|jgi:hypothetical protein|nr:hypothetical protein [Methylobacteriaceae bacterium]